jgi:CheY-like chemotaxis protein
VQPRPLSLNEAVRGMEGLLRPLLGKGVQLQLSLSEDLPPVLADLSQLEQVLLNLAVNARDAMPSGGTLTFRTRRGPDDWQHPGQSFALLSVEDTGTGMSEEVRERIFEPFFTTKPTGHGTGLGLAVVKAVVGQAGGQVQVESTPGQGTQFHVLWPLATAPAEPRALPPRTQALPLLGPPGSTVLLVEDDPAVRRSVKRVLEAGGVSVLAVSRAQEALVEAERMAGRLDLVLTDVGMPQLSGWDLAAKLCERYPDLPVLVMSGFSEVLRDPALREDACLAGILDKPFTPEALRESVARALGRPRPTAARRAGQA